MKTLLLLLILNFSASACMLDTEIRISGQIINAKSDKIKIGETIVPISKDGRFLFISETDSPVFFDIVYDQLTWPVYLEPGKTIDLSSDGINLDSICYKKDLTNENSYLLTTLKTNESLNAYFNQNWYPLHVGSESALIYAIDSLKQLYLVDLEKYQVSKKFTEMFTAALNFSLDSFILQYPGRHLEFTGEKILLSREAMDYIDIKDLQNAEMCDLTTYEEFGRNYIDYQIDNAYREFRGKKHYNLWKMDKIFGFIKKTFKDQYLSDFWISKYLADHISFTGVANSRLFVEKFSDICKTEEFKSTVQSTYNNAVRKRQDHTIKIYKNVNGFKLEAHIFYPEDMNNNIKRPAVAIFHGGGWTTGTPEWAFNLSRHYAGYGMIGIAVQYRLSNYHDITPIEAMEDARDLIKWLRINSDSLGILPHKIAFEGWSAGGHLVTCAAVFPDTLENIKINSIPDALLLTSPAVDIENDGWLKGLLASTGKQPVSISPLYNVKGKMPPTLILEGKTDHVTPLDGVEQFHKKIKSFNSYSELHVFQNVGHMFTPSNLDDTGWPQPDKDVQKEAQKKKDAFLLKLGYYSE